MPGGKRIFIHKQWLTFDFNLAQYHSISGLKQELLFRMLESRPTHQNYFKCGQSTCSFLAEEVSIPRDHMAENFEKLEE